MDMFKKARDRVMQSVGLAEKMPQNPRLLQHAEKLKQLGAIMSAMRRSVESYASSMLTVGDASRAIANDISKFYSRSQSHQKNVNIFITAMVDQESNALYLFREEFTQEISQEFDKWSNENNTLKQKLLMFDSHFNQLAQDKQLQNIDARSFNQKHQSLEKELGMLEVQINNFAMNRFAKFDKIFAALMKLQQEFFNEGSEVTTKFSAVIQEITSPMPVPTSAPTSVPTSAPEGTNLKHPNSTTSIPTKMVPPTTVTPKSPESHSSSTSPAPVASKTPTPTSTTTTNQGTTAGNTTQKSTSNTIPTAPYASFDILNLNNTVPITTTPSVPPPSSSQTTDLFGLFSTDSTKPSGSVSTSQHSKTNETFDILGFTTSPQKNTHTPKTTSATTPSTNDFNWDFLNTTTSTMKQQPTQSASSTSQFTFDPDFFSSATPTTNSKPLPSGSYASSSIDDIDDSVSPIKSPSNSSTLLDDDILSGFTYGSTSSASKPYTFVDPLGPDFGTKPSTTSSSFGNSFSHQNLPQGPEMSQTEEQDAIHEALRLIEPKINQWRYKNGIEKEIPALLASLTTVLWEGHNWKKVDITSLLDYDSVKKSYRRALITVHPDKVVGSTPLIKATSERVFEVLNSSFKQYEIKLGKRSA